MPTCVPTGVRKAEDRAQLVQMASKGAAYRVSMKAALLPTGVSQGMFKLANSHPVALQ